jgi:hypothetical protein
MNKTSSLRRVGGGWASDWDDMHPDASSPSKRNLFSENGFEFGDTADEGFRAGREAFRSGISLVELKRLHKRRAGQFKTGMAKGWRWQQSRN